MKPSWRNVWFSKYLQVTFFICNIQYIWTDYTDIRTDYWKNIHLILFLLYIKYQYFYLLFFFFESPTLFLMKLILRYEKKTLLTSECRKRFKVTLIFSSYSWLGIHTLVRGPIYCSTFLILDYVFFKTLIFFVNILFFTNRHQITSLCRV